jgi:hypothetical protein
VEKKWIEACSSVDRHIKQASILESCISISFKYRILGNHIVVVGSWKVVWFNLNTTFRTSISVSSRQWVESRKLIPSSTNLLLLSFILISLLLITTNIGTCEWNTEHIEVHYLCNRIFHVIPSTSHCSQTMYSILT